MKLLATPRPDFNEKAGRAGQSELAQLVQQAAEGSGAAFADLYDMYAAQIFRYIFFRVYQKEEAEDLAADVFVRVWQKLVKFRYRSETSFRSWLFTIARNRVIDFYRAKKNQVPLLEKDLRVEGADSELEAVEQSADVRDAIAQLPANYQEVVILRFIEGWGIKETADFLNRTEGALRVMQHRALRRLAEIIEEDEADA